VNHDDATEPIPSRYVVGIDLGTTNSAIAAVDTSQSNWDVEIFSIPQVTSAGQVESLEILPSFHLQATPAEIAAGAVRLPWQSDCPNYSVGKYARDAGTQLPGWQIASAKSWLCHAGVDRRGEILPWHAAESVERLSPVEVSARFLLHLREAWDARHPHDPLSGQDVVLTLPASFDEVARELTVEAANKAGLPRVTLIEEPQAAFYAWIHKHARDWQARVDLGQKILVCDIGGGTTDFTLIRVRQGDHDRVQFHRVAVGDHLVLGGDNLDLALARHLESRMGGAVDTRQWDALLRSSRRVKEELLGAQPPDSITVHIPGSGAKLIGGGAQCVVTRAEVESLLLDGFFPQVALTDRPRARQSGFQEFGLPFAADPAVTRHLAEFLTAHRHVAIEDGRIESNADPARPDIVLLNGGMFESPRVRQRLLEVIGQWFSQPGSSWSPQLLDNDRLDLAVARGAAYYGMVRRGAGVRIAASLARSYYIGVEQESHSSSDASVEEHPLLCLVPGNAEPGMEIVAPDRTFLLRLAQPVEFPLYVSSVRLTDLPGDLVPFDPSQIKPLPPIRTALKTRGRNEGDLVRVRIHARLSEIGTLELFCRQVDSDRAWRLDFDIRSATQTEIEATESTAERSGTLDEQTWTAIRQALRDLFSAEGRCAPDAIARQLVAASGMPREEWPPTLLRRIWAELFELEAGRKRSAIHEARWLNLLGYALRPGYGVAVDDWRVKESWRLLQGKLLHSSPHCRTESLILWRRVAGGLTAGQQKALAEPLLGAVRAIHRRYHSGKEGVEPTLSPHEANEVLRLLGSLELLPLGLKNELGRMLLDLVAKKKLEPMRSAMLWTLGRVGARVPTYGPLNSIVPVEVVSRWIARLLEEPLDPQLPFVLMLLARRTRDRYRDIADPLRAQVAGWLSAAADVPSHFRELVENGGTLDSDEQSRAFGESLPRGLRLMTAGNGFP
jgi:molecular chaperone DnaK (HSP70)